MPFLPLPPRTVGAWGRKRFVGEFHTRGGHTALCCRLISSFYIKPQLMRLISLNSAIVLYRLSTSNHNYPLACQRRDILSYIVFLHQTTTQRDRGAHNISLSYIVFLHQTTTIAAQLRSVNHCLISSFYIKPQPRRGSRRHSHHCLISSFYIKPQPLRAVF